MVRRLVALFLVLMLASSTFAAPASAQSTDPEQPSTVNPVLYFWGNEDITECWQHFDAEGSEGSAEDGYGEEIDGGDSQRLEVSITCEMRDAFGEDIFLNPNGKILIEFGVRVDHAGTEEEENEDLSITLMKGNLEVARKEFPDLTTDEDEQIIWELDVDENTTRWNSSGDEPRIKFEMSKPGWVAYGTPCDVALRCGGSFRLYYANNQDGMRSQIQFPIVDAPEEIEEVVSEEGGILPGFEMLSGLGALALASAGRRTRSIDN